MKKIKLTAGLALFSVLAGNLYSRENFNMDFDRGVSMEQIKETLHSTPVPVPAPQTFENDKGFGDWFSGGSKQKEWTIMVYINAKNDLERFGMKDVNEMEKVGSTSKINIVVELGRMKGYYDGEEDWTGLRRYLIQRDFDEDNITSPIVEKNPSVDMGDWKHLVDFAKWARTQYPAKRYMLIVWNHGNGWKTSKSFSFKGISLDEETNNHISTKELGQAMAQIGKVDILAFDACLMQMAEVMYEVKDYAEVIAGSEETVPAYGFSYDAFLKKLKKNSEAGPDDAAKFLVETFNDFYTNIQKKSTISAVRTNALPEFIKLVNEWADAAINSGNPSVIRNKVSWAKYYEDSDNKDLFDFVKNVTERTDDSFLAEKGKKLMDFLSNQLVIDSRATHKYGGIDDKSRGVAVYLPEYKYNSKYDSLAWSVDGKWDDFLKFINPYSPDNNTTPGTGSSASRCVDPGPNASILERMEYLNCLLEELDNILPKKTN